MKMKNTNENTNIMGNHRLEIGERLKCGEVFIKNLDGYTSMCAVECQLCEDRSICSLTEFIEHLEIWHNDWEDELQHDEMQEVAEEFATTTDKVIQPFEKVLIVTETAKSSTACSSPSSLPLSLSPLSDLAFLESEEISEASEQCDRETNESFDSCTNTLNGSQGVACTIKSTKTIKPKPKEASTHTEEERKNDKNHTSDLNEECSIECRDSLEELEYQASSLSSDYTEMEQANGEVQKEHIDWTKCNNGDDNNNDDDDDDDSDSEDDRNLIDRSEDSGVEKSEVGSLTASTPQHLTSEDEAEQRKLFIKEQVRIVMNEPPSKPNLTSVHLEKLLEQYEAHPRLWQKSHPEYNQARLCRKSWKEITRTWNRECRQKLSMRDIRIRISTLCHRYLKERQRREMANEIDETKGSTIVSRFKYFEKMKFLETHQNTPYERHTARLAEEHEKLLEIYSHLPILWSNTDRHHESVELRQKAYNDICTALQLIGIHIPPKMIRQRLTTLRKRYRLEKMRHLYCKLQGKSFETNFKQYEKMKFLDRYIAPFVCDTCGKIFRNLADYETHMIVKQHGEKVEVVDQLTESTTLQSVVPIPHLNSENNAKTATNQSGTLLLDYNVVNEIIDQSSERHETLDSVSGNAQTPNAGIENSSTREGLQTIISYENTSKDNSLISMNAEPKDPIGNFSNLLEIPYILQNLDGNEELRNYFSEDQFFTLTNAAVEPSMAGFENNDPLKGLNTIDRTNFNHTSEDNLIPMNITLQVLENSVEISPVAAPFVPIGLILDEAVNNLVVPEIPQDAQGMEIVAQYFDQNQLIPVNVSVEDAAMASKSQNDAANYYTNVNALIPMAISYGEADDPLFSNGSHKNVENYFQQDQFMPISEVSNGMYSPMMLLDNSQSSTQTFSTTSHSEMRVAESLHRCDLNTQRAFAMSCIENKTGQDASAINSIAVSNKGKTTSTEESKAAEKLTAKIDCGNLHLQIDLPCSRENKSEETLLGRLPREQALELIARYRDYPELWHPENANYTSRRMRRLAWKSLAKDLNKNLNTNFNWLQVQRKIMDYVKYYRHERRRVQNNKGCSQWTFYDQFQFLDEVLKPPSDVEKRIQQRTTTLKIIETYEAHPQMWNTKHPDYTKRHQRHRSVAEICARLKEVHNITIDEAKLKQRLQELRKEFRRTKIARIIAEKRNESFEPLSHFEFYEPLKFLEDHVPPFDCGECKMEFKCFTEYNFHMKREHKDYKRVIYPLLATDIDKSATENICHICGIKFTLRHNLLQHLNRHYVGRTLPCSECGKKFFTKNALREHQRTHTKEPAVICADCGQTFVNVSKLNQHMKRHRNQRDHKCDTCNKLFYTAFDRDRHVRQHLQIRDKVCPVCGRAFVSGSSFYAHMKLHNEKKEYVCSFCNKEFAQYAGLYKHRKRYHPVA